MTDDEKDGFTVVLSSSYLENVDVVKQCGFLLQPSIAP